MATLSSFFGSSGGGAAGVASTFRVFYETGSMTVPSCAVFAAYGVIGGGGVCPRQTVNCFVCLRGGGGGGFSWKEAAQSCASDFTVCAIVGAAGEVCGGTSCFTVKNQGGASCITGFSGGTICATGGSCYVPGAGSGGDINTSGGCGSGGACRSLGGSGAGGLYGNGGSACSGRGGGGFGSGGGGGASGEVRGYEDVQCAECGGLWCRIFPSQGGGGGQAGDYFNGGTGLSGVGGIGQVVFTHRDCCHTSMAAPTYPPEGGMIPQYTMCGYSQAKTFLSASGGGGGGYCTCHCVQYMNDNTPGGQQGAPGGGGGWHGGGNNRGAPNGGFGAGAGSVACNNSECGGKGKGGIGAGANVQFTGADACSGEAGQGIAVVEYWVTTS